MRKLKQISLAIIIIMCLAVPVFFNCNASAPQALGSVRLNIETYLAGQNQPTHPSVVAFPELWNGAKYWLAYSPYPYGNGEEENPCVAVSNDLLYWNTPAGLANPIADNEETGCDELKDPQLLYRSDLDRLEMWYLGRLAEHLGGDGTSLLLFRKYSYDGISWSDYEIMTSVQYLSPSIFWDGTKYQMWSIGYDLWDTAGTIVYQESTDGLSWTQPENCCLDSKKQNVDIWHGSVTFYEGNYNLVYIDNSDKQEIYYCCSEDGVRFTEPEVVIENSGYWDFLYRPTLVYDEGSVSCLYGVVNQENQWYISMSTGDDVYHLTGINEIQKKNMLPLSDEVIDTHSIPYRIKCLHHAIHTCFRPELMLLAVIEAIMIIYIKALQRKKNCLGYFTLFNSLISFIYIAKRLQPATYVSWFGAIVAIICLNIGMTAVLRCIYIPLTKEQ